MTSAHDVADYFLHDAAEHGDRIRHMKLQKLCYYAQGFYVGLHGGRALFTEPIVAWQYGPVVRELWTKFRGYGSRPIPAGDTRHDALPVEIQEYLDLVVARLGAYNDWDLSHATHQEDPWRDARKVRADGGSDVITNDALRRWFEPRAHWLAVTEAPGPPSEEDLQRVRNLAGRLRQ